MVSYKNLWLSNRIWNSAFVLYRLNPFKQSQVLQCYITQNDGLQLDPFQVQLSDLCVECEMYLAMATSACKDEFVKDYQVRQRSEQELCRSSP